MKKLETIQMKDNTGISIWLTPEASALSAEFLKDATEFEIRTILRADEGNILKVDGNFWGKQLWLTDRMSKADITEVPESEWLAEEAKRQDNNI